MGKTFPQVQPGGSLILAWRVKDRHVLVVGGGEVGLCVLRCLTGFSWAISTFAKDG